MAMQMKKEDDAGMALSIPTTPKDVAAARSTEKKDLQHLNEKLSEHIGLTSALTAENKRLRHDLDTLNAVFASLDERLRKQYEDEIDNLRKALDKALADKAVAIKKASNLEDDLKKSEASLAEETSKHEKTKKKLPQLEKTVVERDGQIDLLTKNVRVLQEELKSFKLKLNESQLELGSSYRGVEIAAVEQMQFDVKLEAKDDEIEFLKSIYEEQIELLSQIEISNNNVCCPDHLIETLKDIRADYESVLRSRESADPDAWYKSKFDQVMKIGEQKKEALAAEKRKVDDWRKKYEKIRDDLDLLEKLAEEERKKCQRAEETLSAALEDYAADIREKDDALDAVKAQFAQLLEILRRLVDPDLSVTAELNEAKKLIEAGVATTN